jgi:hypothetical protein
LTDYLRDTVQSLNTSCAAFNIFLCSLAFSDVHQMIHDAMHIGMIQEVGDHRFRPLPLAPRVLESRLECDRLAGIPQSLIEGNASLQ